MKKNYLCWLLLLIFLSGCHNISAEIIVRGTTVVETGSSQSAYTLPSPETSGDVSVEEALFNRRSHRRFEDKELSAKQLSQILWAAYGITEPIDDNPALRGGLRTSPSAGALYPLEIYVVVGGVTGIEPGVYKYMPEENKIIRTVDRDIRAELTEAALGQSMVKDAPITVVYTAVFQRITQRYGERGRQRYVYMEIGHSAQNVYLQAEALGLGTVAVGAFHDGRVSELLDLPKEEEPLYLMPVGYKD